MFGAVSVWTTLVSVVFMILWQGSLTFAQVNETLEPPLSVKLHVHGETIPAHLGRPVELSIEGKKIQLTVTEGDDRTFQLKHLRFCYPAYFKFEVDFIRGTEIPVRWDLKGHDIRVTVFRAASGELYEQEGKNVLDEWVTRFLGDKPIVEDTKELELGQMKIEGVRYKLPLKLGNNDLEMCLDVFEVPGQFGSVRYFLFLGGFDGENPDEELLVRKLLRESFTVTNDSGGPK